MYMHKRTTIEIDGELLDRAKRALGSTTTKATVEEALRRVAEAGEDRTAEQATRQRRFFETLSQRVDPTVLTSGEMWR